MKTHLLINGGVRHIVGWLGLTYCILFLMVALGMFKSFFETVEGQVIMTTIIVFITAFSIEMYNAYKQRKGAALSKTKASMPDAIFSAVGGFLGAVLFVSFPSVVGLFLFSALLIAFAIFDRNTDFIANQNRDE